VIAAARQPLGASPGICRPLVKMEELGVELAGEGLYLGGIRRVRRAGQPLPDPKAL